MPPSLATLLLFPSLEYHQLSVGPYSHTVAQEAVAFGSVTALPPTGVEIGYRHFTEDDIPLMDDSESWSPTGTEHPMHARIAVDPDGVVFVDQLSVGNYLLGATVRRPLGDLFGLNLLGGQWESTVHMVDAGRFQLRAIVPSELGLLGFTNTDFDADNRLKYTISVGSGIGGDVMGRLLGPLGLYSRVLASARTFNRHQGGTQNQVRHELHAEAEMGLAVFGGRHAFWLSGWGELTSQYETRDPGGKDGLDRQYAAWGLRLNARLHPDPTADSTEEPTTKKNGNRL